MRMSILGVLVSVGMVSSLPKLVHAGPPKVLSVLLDGRIVGSIPIEMVEKAVSHLRRLKLSAMVRLFLLFFFPLLKFILNNFN